VQHSEIIWQVAWDIWDTQPSSLGDPDVWFHPATKVTGEEYYEYLLVYTDDILAIGVKPKEILTHLNKYFSLKPDSIHPPDED
jgi:hypothetical protein